MQIISKHSGLSIPTWALGYLVNGDCQGLNEAEICQIESFLEGFGPGQVLFSSKESEFFTKCPEFGLPCTCVEAEIIMAK